ncbi:MAG: tetratricopeptide repeat protein, partial [Saprospiraceae bacterium]
EDEMKATLLRDKLKNILEDEVRAHHGRVLKLSGDGALCIFNSAIEATYAAIAIQKYMSEDPKVPLRIGIHSGDVMFEEGDVHGDGVNIASRIESFAVPGSVFISGKLHDEIKNQKNIDTISLGRFDLKNVSEPVEIYAVSNEGLVVPQKKILVGKGGKYSGTKTPSHTWMILMTIITVTSIVAFFLYKKTQTAQLTGIEKSIAVLPFTNMSGDMDNEYFSDGITEDIITRLSQVSDLKVISRTSVMRFKNTTKNIKDIASELDVASILEGSVQKSGNKLRITAQLINAQSDEHLWAEKYDVELKDIFQVQSDVSELIALSLKATLTAFQKSRIEKKPTENLEAYNLYLRANYLWNKQTLESIGQAADLYKQAIKLDSNFAQAYAATAIASVSGGLRESSWEEHLENIHKNAEHAVSLDSNLASAHTALGQFYFMSPSLNDSIMAMKEFDKAIELDPNYAHAWTYKGWLYELNYEFEKAMPFVATALNLDPLSPIRMISMA